MIELDISQRLLCSVNFFGGKQVKELSVVNFISVSNGTENDAKDVRYEYIHYFNTQEGSIFYLSYGYGERLH